MNKSTVPSVYNTRYYPLDQFIENVLAEDLGDGDHTSLACIPGKVNGKAQLLVKDAGIIAGVAVAREVFRKVDPQLVVQVKIKDGSSVRKGDVVLTVKGSAASILKAERLVLNIMQRMSGIATQTAAFVAKCKGTPAQVIDTRKTSPGMRILEKWAVQLGGGTNHRIGLYDMILIKDNHIDYAGGIEKAIDATRNYLSKHRKKLKIEIEVRNLQELEEVLAKGGIHRIMLDNFSISDLKKAVRKINGKYETEASGGITEKNIRSYAQCGVDFISVGALTHHIKSLDLSLKAY